jgi:hypothetical protein
MHTAKKNYIKEKSRYSDQFIETADQTPPKQHQKSINSKSVASKKGAMHKRRHRHNQIPWVLIPEKVRINQHNDFH